MKKELNEAASVTVDAQRIAHEIIERAKKNVKDITTFTKARVGGFGPMVDSASLCYDLDYIGYDGGIFNGLVTRIFVTIFIVTAQEYLQYSHFFNVTGYYREDTKDIQINLIGIRISDSKIEYAFQESESALSHELTHAYQRMFGRLKRGKFYVDAVKLYMHSSNNKIRTIAYGLYYFNNSEISARMNSLYNELVASNIKSKEEAIETCEYEDFLQARNAVQKSLKDINKEEISALENALNTKFSTIKKLIENGISVNKTKIGRVIAYYLYELQEKEMAINETTFDPKMFDISEKTRNLIFDAF